MDILNDNYIVNKKNYNISHLYLNKLLILTFDKWYNSNSTNYYCQHSTEIKKLLDVQYSGPLSYKYMSDILYCEKINEKDDVIYDVIKYFETVINDIREKEIIKQKEDSMKKTISRSQSL